MAFVRATRWMRTGGRAARMILIRFSIAEPGVIAAVDSADNASVEPFQATKSGGRIKALRGGRAT